MKTPMQRLTVSNEVFFKLRALGQSETQSEDQNLRRLLDGAAEQSAENRPNHTSREAEGFEDATYGIVFPEGFEIFRTYKGRPYTASVVRGRWRLGEDSGLAHTRPHDSLNQLSQAVIDGNENAWMFWYFKAPDGTPKRIAELRDPAMVQKRPRHPRRSRRLGWVTQSEIAPETALVPEPAEKPVAASRVGAESGPRTKPRRKPPASPTPTPASTPATGPGGGRAWEPGEPAKRD